MSEIKTKKSLAFTASSLRIMLLVMMLLIVVGGVTGIAFGLQTIRAYAVEVSHKKVDAEASNSSIQSLQKMQDYLDSNRDVLQKVGLLKSKSEFPEFKVVDEVRQIAAKNNMEIASFSYGSESSSDTGSTGQTTTPSTTGGTAPTAPTTSQNDTASSSGGDTIALTVTFSAPSYLDYLQFTYDLEQHLPKMKIKGIGVSGGSSSTSGTGGSGSSSSSSGITVDPITIEMYIEK